MEAARELEVKLEGSGNCQSLADHHGFGFPGETTSPVYRCLKSWTGCQKFSGPVSGLCLAIGFGSHLLGVYVV